MKSLKSFFKRYAYAWPLCYIFIYFPWFFWLEKHVTDYTVIHCALDDYIPFCEYFIIPYLFWFVYIAGTVLLLLFQGTKKDFQRCCLHLFSGMSIALFICTVFPNGQNLRPVIDDTPTIFTKIVQILFTVDTDTNVFPSIHVFNSIAAHMALAKSMPGQKHKWIAPVSAIIMVLICMSTVFLKQHSFVDLMGGVALALILYRPIYQPKLVRQNISEHKKKRAKIAR